MSSASAHETTSTSTTTTISGTTQPSSLSSLTSSSQPSISTTTPTPTPTTKQHLLQDTWTLWAHLPHDTDWTLKSYKKIFTFQTMEYAIALTETLPEILVNNCMLFLMRNGIHPMWEDPKNRHGGCFSYRVENKTVFNVWKDMSYVLIGESISNNKSFTSHVNGITISPKKKFCIIKIWMNDCSHQNPNFVTPELTGITSEGCLFKSHKPEF